MKTRTPLAFRTTLVDDDEISGSEDVAFDWNGDDQVEVLAPGADAPIIARRPISSAPLEGWPPEAGTVLLGKYEVEKVLGRGGMGVVIVANHLQLRQRVAIKFLHPDAMRDPDVILRFAREARVLASIQSEHVVRILDVGTLDRGEPYMVMECLEGTDLSRLVKERGPLPVAEAVDFVLQACEPLAEAHAAGIVHRDLKPSNLYLARRADDSHIIKVIDFGISKLMSIDGAEQEMSMTKTSVILGSPLYISPEQLRSAKDVDARADIWSLGVILYKLLTGKAPFLTDTIAQLCAMILLQSPPKMTDFRADIPGALEDVILKCMAKDAADRYQNVAELAQALSDFSLAPHAAQSVQRTTRLLKTSLPSRSGISIQKPELPRSLATTSSGITDGGAAVTVGGAIEPLADETSVAAKRKRFALFVMGGVCLALFGLAALGVALAFTRHPAVAAMSVRTEPVVAAAAAPPPQAVSVPPVVEPVIAAPPASAEPTLRTAAPVPTASGSTPAAAAHVPRPVWTAPAPKPKLDNSQFGDRK